MDRPRRAVKRPLTYWEEYVVTDVWYTAALVEDVPPGELYAALEDEDFSEECGEEGVDEDDEGFGANILSDEYDSEYATEDCSNSDSTEDSEGSAEVLGACEGDSGSEGSDDTSSCGSVC